MLLAGRTGIIIGDPGAGEAYCSHPLNIAPGTLRQTPIARRCISPSVSMVTVSG